MADFGFGQGLMTGQKMMLAEREQENAALEADLKGKKLQLESAQLAQSMEMNRQKIATDLFTQSVETMKGLHETVKNVPFVKPGSALDQAIDRQKTIIAKLAEKTGQDPGMAEVMAQGIRSAAGTGIKPMGVSAGGAIVNPQTGEVLHQQPTQGPQDPEKLRLLRGAEAVLGRKLTEQESLRILGAAPGSESQSRFRPTGSYVDKETGTPLGEGFFDQAKGKFLLQVPGNPEPQEMPANAMPVTESSMSRNVLTGEQFLKLADETREAEQSIRAVTRYFENVKDSAQGFEVLADKFVGQLKTIFGKDINQAEFNTLVQSGQLQGLIGRFRKDIVGGGVMTEQDALRIISALGGDVSALRNKAVVAELMKNLVREKIDDYESRLRPAYNQQLKTTPRGKEFKEKPSFDIDVDKLFTASAAKPTPATTAGQAAPADNPYSSMSDEEILNLLKEQGLMPK